MPADALLSRNAAQRHRMRIACWPFRSGICVSCLRRTCLDVCRRSASGLVWGDDRCVFSSSRWSDLADRSRALRSCVHGLRQGCRNWLHVPSHFLEGIADDVVCHLNGRNLPW